jgi:hypothetical protein
MRQSLGTAVFSGMLGVTLFGLIFTPVFFVVCRALPERFAQFLSRHKKPVAATEATTGAAE